MSKEKITETKRVGGKDSWHRAKAFVARTAVRTGYIAAISFFTVPVLWIISLSFRSDATLYSNFVLLPTDITFAAYTQVLEAGILQWFLNTVIVSALSILGVLLVTVPASYAFSRMNFRGRRTALLAILTFQMISSIVIVIPLYQVMQTLNMIGTMYGLILVYIGIQIPFSIWLLKGFFDTIPPEVDQAAMIDGCNRLQILRHVLLDPIKPGLAVVSIFNLVFYWSEFAVAYTILGVNDNVVTLSMGIFNFERAASQGTDWQAIAAASVIGMIPLILLFILLQRYFIRGLTDGAVKG